MDIIDKIYSRLRPNKFYDMLRMYESLVKKHRIQRGVFLEFGSWRGASALAFYSALKRYYKKDIPAELWPMFLFDSFEGLPDPSNKKDFHPVWIKGEFNAGGIENFIKSVTEKGLPLKRFECVAGYYEKTLVEFKLPKGYKAGIVNMDCDYYSSTKLALNFLKPYLQNFTLFHFDDINSFSGNPYKGQLAAIREFNEENKNMGICPCPRLSAPRWYGKHVLGRGLMMNRR